MTSQLNVDTIVDKAGSGGSNVKMANTSTYVSDGGATTQNTVQGLSKAWFNLEGDITTPITRDSFNTGSVTDNGTGDYTVALTNHFVNENNVFVSDGGYSQSVGGPYVCSSYYYGSSDLRRMRVGLTNGTLTDCEQVNGSLFGDLA